MYNNKEKCDLLPALFQEVRVTDGDLDGQYIIEVPLDDVLTIPDVVTTDEARSMGYEIKPSSMYSVVFCTPVIGKGDDIGGYVPTPDIRDPMSVEEAISRNLKVESAASFKSLIQPIDSESEYTFGNVIKKEYITDEQISSQETESIRPMNLKNNRGLLTEKLDLPSSITTNHKVCMPKSIFTDEMSLDADAKPLASKLCEYLLKAYKIRCFKNKLYVFNPELGYYLEQDFDNMNRWINKVVGVLIKERGGTSYIYAEIQRLLKAEYSIYIAEYETPKAWCFKDGVMYEPIDGRLEKNDGSYFITSVLNCRYDPYAPEPEKFNTFIKAIANGCRELETLLWEIIAIILSNEAIKELFVFYGVSNSGKSLLSNTLQEIVGVNNTKGLFYNDFGKPFALSELENIKLNIAPDISNKPLDETSVAAIKALTGGDTISADVKNRRRTTFKYSGKLLFVTNHRLKLKYPDDAFQDRMIEVHFTYSVPKEFRDPELIQCFREEYDAIAMKAMGIFRGMKLKNTSGAIQFTKVPEIMMEEQNNEQSKELLMKNIYACFEITDNKKDKLLTREAYEYYIDYVSRSGRTPVDSTTFGKAFRTYARQEDHTVRINSGENPQKGVYGMRIRQ